ncbi:ATP-dependent DNA helicase [Mycena indigotica]|uniref:ATP-dependent DNA helicase n=1 Tax=Mycena indigotica TaxID=2126181 RepID=A0A8H6T4J6_9AGAR|nr:ATP-dependent DNA helicase [Mycena indigotica]KAF7311960.1 ATP-dependent DNA helicase [Mycena indigotica]
METHLAHLTKVELLTLLRDIVAPIPSRAQKNRGTLIAYLETHSEQDQQAIIVAAGKTATRKRPAAPVDHPPKRQRTNIVQERFPQEVDIESPQEERIEAAQVAQPRRLISANVGDEFMRVPAATVVEDCISRVIDRTGNAALKKAVCVCCARRVFARQTTSLDITEIPNKVVLQPTHPHPSHNLYEGCLIHPQPGPVQNICDKCYGELRKAKRPQLSLANNMWIGKVPVQLEVLSLAERLLISLHFPACYIIKLYARRMGRNSSADHMNHGLRGNVSSYKLNQDRIAAMVSGTIMPQPPEILAATIGITFVGGKNRPLPVYPKQVQVNRFRVHDALLWLKQHNPLYGAISISEETLVQLPESGVPDEIANNVRYSENIEAVDREHQNYVRHDDDSDDDMEQMDEGQIFQQGPSGPAVPRNHVTLEDCESSGDEDFDPEVIPLQTSGVLDTTGDEIPDHEMFQHAATNAAGIIREREFFVRRSRAYVNEYGREDGQGNPTDGGVENPNHLLGAFPTLFPYGMGGLEVDRETKVPYESHIRWALQYDDGRFRKDIYFMFQAFGVIQKRQICRAASIHIKRSSFFTHKLSFLLMTPADLMKELVRRRARIRR